MYIRTSCISDSVLRRYTSTPLPLSRAERVVIALGEKIEDVVCGSVKGKGHEERVEKVKSMVHFDQSLQQTIKRTTVHLKWPRVRVYYS